MPIQQTVTVTVPTYSEVRRSQLEQIVTNKHRPPSPVGLHLVAYFQEEAARKQTDWYERRQLLLAARAKYSISREIQRLASEVGAEFTGGRWVNSKTLQEVEL